MRGISAARAALWRALPAPVSSALFYLRVRIAEPAGMAAPKVPLSLAGGASMG